MFKTERVKFDDLSQWDNVKYTHNTHIRHVELFTLIIKRILYFTVTQTALYNIKSGFKTNFTLLINQQASDLNNKHDSG